MARTANPTHVTGKRPRLKIQPPITHPAFCFCQGCQKLPEVERGKPHDIRIRRVSKYPDDFIKSALYALEVKAVEEARLKAGGDGWMAASPERITFAQLASAYMEAHDSERNTAIIRLHLVPVFGTLPAAQLKASDFRSYQRKRLQVASPDTVNREWTALRAVLNFAEREERIVRNPLRRGAVEVLPSRGPRKEFFEPEEWRAFLAVFDDYDGFKAYLWREHKAAPARIVGEKSFGVGRRNPNGDAVKAQFENLHESRQFIRALLFSCSRLMELGNLRWRDVDLRRGLVTLYQEKTQREKILPIAEPWRAELESRQRGLPEAYVYVRANGRPFYRGEIRRAVILAKNVAGIQKNLTAHSIRHTVLSWLAIAGVPEVHRMEIAGHSRSSVADGYAHLTKGSLVPVVATLERIEAGGFREEESAADLPAKAILRAVNESAE
jgi:integrase